MPPAAKRRGRQPSQSSTPSMPRCRNCSMGGLPAIHARHQAAGDRIRSGVKALGLSLFPEDESYASNTVTAIKCPDGFAVADIRKAAADMDVVLAGGQARLSDSIFRIGHLGYMPDEELDEALEVLGKALEQVGFAPAAATV